MRHCCATSFSFNVAPPRGERGLKYVNDKLYKNESGTVAPPRGERGLKCVTNGAYKSQYESLPLVGSVD